MQQKTSLSSQAATELVRREGVQKRALRFFPFFALITFVLFDRNSAILDRNSDVQTVTAKASEVTFEEPSISSSSWDIAILEAQELLSNINIDIHAKNSTQNDLPSCLFPNKKKTSTMVQNLLTGNPNSANSSSPLLPLPVMNLGLPKCGSTTLYNFFRCIGLRTTHWAVNTEFFEGLCMRDAVNAGLPPIKTCAPHTDAFTQFDVEFPFGYTNAHSDIAPQFYSYAKRDDCFFPQLSLLEEIHAENPTVTFVMNFRPIHDWIRSVRGWGDMMKRFRACNLPNLPMGYPKNPKNETQVFATMTQFWCSHVQHVRNFVEAHPSHALIELDLYDTDHSKEVMSALFPSSTQGKSKCWKHRNKSKKLDE